MNQPITKPVLCYVDDDHDDLMLFQAAVSDFDAEVHLFDDGEKMFDALSPENMNPTHIFVDLNMPILSGYEVIAKLKVSEKLRSVPIIVLSTAGDQFTIEKCRAAGVNFYVQKPTSVAKLREAIEFVLAKNWSDFKPNDAEFAFKF